MEFLIISGLSGAGKSQAAGILEDLDYYCVDNMPVAMIPQFAELCLATRGRYEKIALVTDIRERGDFSKLLDGTLDKLAELGVEYKILFLEAGAETIVKRYKETRRKHPIDPSGANVASAVERERATLAALRDRANFVVDTTNFTFAKLAKRLMELFSESGAARFAVNCNSFGFKYGAPADADLIFDVRFLPNPYYVAELAPLTGRDAAVSGYVLSQSITAEFLEKLYSLIDFLLPNYIEEGKHSLIIAVGCTGGRHRSVAIAETLAAHISKLGYQTYSYHRDIDK
ncbi:MAG: RNase adapter RapZ [Oscillospiraceae bacterium]|jgi:UPF0042 nucleotide-binding protein|nr:RNase adapter RapZ [Oscillospiraceae bacterium]